jgi:hypothetical protein
MPQLSGPGSVPFSANHAQKPADSSMARTWPENDDRRDCGQHVGGNAYGICMASKLRLRLSAAELTFR